MILISKKIFSFLILVFLLIPSISTAKNPKPYFSFSLRQNGKTVKIKNHIAVLEKKPFQLILTMNRPMDVLVNASLKSDIYKALRAKVSPDSIALFDHTVGKGMADEFLNPNKSIFIDDEAFNVFFYTDEKSHRFDKVTLRNNTIVGRRSIDFFHFLKADFPEPEIVPVSAFSKNNLYLAFANVHYNDDFAQKILQTNYLKIQFVESIE